MKKFLLLFTAALCACQGPKLTRVDKLGAAEAMGGGLYYFLPRADVLVQIEVTRTTKTPGEFVNKTCLVEPILTAEQEKEIIRAEEVTYELGEVVVKPVPGIDVGHIYRLDLPKNFLSKNDLTLEYAPTGELKGGTIASEDLTAKVVTQVAVSLASVAGAFVGGKAPLAGQPVTKTQTCPPASSEEAVEVYDTFKELWASRTQLLSTMQMSEQVETTKWKVATLDAQLQSMLGRFVGTVEKKTITLSFLLDPKDWKAGGELTLFELHKNKGVKKVATSEAVVWNNKFDRKDMVDQGKPVTLKWVVPTSIDNLYSTKVVNTNEQVPKARLAYRIPKQGQVLIQQDKVTKAVKDLTIPQLGGLGYLPDLKSAEFTLYGGTGGLMKLTASTKTIDPDQISAGANAILELDSAFKGADPKDPRDKVIADLEKLVKIKELEDKLNGVVQSEED